MADRYAVASGNWSDPLIWDGGMLPGVGDVVRPNGFTVEIDQDIEVAELRNDESAPAGSGGYFTFAGSGSYSLVAELFAFTNYSGLLNVSSIGGSISIVGNVYTSSGGNVRGIVVTNSSSVSIDGSVYPNFYSGGYGLDYGVLLESGTAFLTINGDVYGGSVNSSHGLYSLSAYAGTVTVNGDVYGGANGLGVRIEGAATLVVTGTIQSSNNYGVYAVSGGAIIDLQGPIIASSAVAGAYLVGPTTVRVKGPLVHHEGTSRAPLVATFFAFHENTQTSWTVMDDTNYPAGNPVVLSNYVTNSPPPADVRSGTIYGPESALVGTLELPQPEQVASGVGVDASEGTSAVRLSDVAAVTGSQITATFD